MYHHTFPRHNIITFTNHLEQEIFCYLSRLEMIRKIMNELKFKMVVMGVIVSKTIIILCTQDVSLPMYMYLANHLTQQECLKLTAYLYADNLGPNAVKELGK